MVLDKGELTKYTLLEISCPELHLENEAFILTVFISDDLKKK